MRRSTHRRQRAVRPVRPLRTVKISLTVDSAVLREVRAVARRGGHTLSAHVSDALARDLRRRRIAEIVADYETRAGLIRDDEVAAARAKWRA